MALDIYRTIKADLERAKDEQCRDMGRDAQLFLAQNIFKKCDKGYATGNLMNGSYGRYQGNGRVVFGVYDWVKNENGVSYARFVNDGTGPVSGKYMNYYDKKYRTWVRTRFRKGIEGVHFMETTLEDLSAKWGKFIEY